MQDPLDRNQVNDLARQETAFVQAERAFSVPLRLSAALSKKKGRESLKLSISTLTTQPKSVKNVPLYLFWPFALLTVIAIRMRVLKCWSLYREKLKLNFLCDFVDSTQNKEPDHIAWHEIFCSY